MRMHSMALTIAASVVNVTIADNRIAVGRPGMNEDRFSNAE